MNSFVSKEFKKRFSKLPSEVQESAKRACLKWRAEMNHPSLAFRQLHPHQVFSVRIGLHYRALCVKVDRDTYLREWIGSHGDYDKLVESLK